MDRTTVAIAGGIGSGKSVVARILTTMGFCVYDCDSRAKQLMDESPAIKEAITRDISPECIVDGAIDRRRLADIVFADADALARLNAIVHQSVRLDIERWRGDIADSVAFVETAILYESGLDRMVRSVWMVDAPERVRIERVARRNNLSEEQIRQRIESQQSFVPERTHPDVHLIINDNNLPLLPQLLSLLDRQNAH